jgi:hypothetical protein
LRSIQSVARFRRGLAPPADWEDGFVGDDRRSNFLAPKIVNGCEASKFHQLRDQNIWMSRLAASFAEDDARMFFPSRAREMYNPQSNPLILFSWSPGLSDQEGPVEAGKDRRLGKQQTKKTYAKPAFRFERVFETQALTCGKIGGISNQCKLNRKNS